MSSYLNFAKYYDKLMNEDINYEKIADFIENVFCEHNLNPKIICDLACGTGNITLPLAKRGYEMIAIDKSVQMLNEASKKAHKENLDILFLNQSITKLDLYGTCDAFLCMIDGINYVLTPSSLIEMFSKIKQCFLNPGGVLIFDISTEYKLSKVIGNNTFIYDSKDIFYSWENKYYSDKKICDMYLNFFIEKKHTYKRFSEHHLQRAYSVEEIKYALIKAGFSNIKTCDDFTLEKPNDNSHRITFVAI